jgi:DNA-binding CsgD family transcriptional regulator
MLTADVLISLIYAAAADASRWIVFLDAFKQAVRGKTAVLWIQDLRLKQLLISCQSGLSTEDLRVYFDRYAASDPMPRAMGNVSEGQVMSSDGLVPAHQLKQSRAYPEYYEPLDICHGMLAVFLKTDTRQFMMSTRRGFQAGPFLETDLLLLQGLVPHLRRAALLQTELSLLRSQRSALTQSLDHLSHGFVLTDSDCRLVFANAVAHKILQNHDGLTVRDSFVRASEFRKDALLRHAISNCAAKCESHVVRLAIPRLSAGNVYCVLVMPISLTPSDFPEIPRAAILIINPESVSELDPFILREMFSFTPTEARIVAGLTQGRNIEEIAKSQFVSVETVRTHVRRILSKTATRRQSELIALILRAAPFAAHQADRPVFTNI